MTTIAAPQKKLKIFIQTLDGAGHVNACIGLGQQLLKRGHEVIFLMGESMAGKFSRQGFGEILMKKTSASPEEKLRDPVKAFAELVLRTGMVSPMTPMEKLQGHIRGKDCFLEASYKTLVDFDPQMEAAIARHRPDVIILAQFLVPPAIARSNVPWLYVIPFAPIGLFVGPQVPPFFAGFPTTSDPSTWAEFRNFQQNEYLVAFRQFQRRLNAACGYSPVEEPEDGTKSHFLKSKHLNIYMYPKELDYTDIAPVPENTFRVDAFCRDELLEPFELPEAFRPAPGSNQKLIFFSLGSMGSIDVSLVKRILKVLATTPHKYIVSKGPKADEYELPDNCWGEAYLPQTRILPLVDLVITHGGNNTITETFSFGKAMVVMPLFSDQYDNAQRIQEKGFGIRVEPFTFEDSQLTEAIEKLLHDDELHRRLTAAAKRIQTERSKEKVCLRIEEVLAKLNSEAK